MDDRLRAGGGAVCVEQLDCTFGRFKALKEINLRVETGEMVALIGSSGAGKSTLLRLIAGLVVGDSHKGSIRVGEQLVQANGVVSRDVRSIRSNIGFVFQQFNLVDRMSLLKNVLVGHLSKMPLYRRLFGIFTYEERLAAMRALRFVGLEDHALQRASTLSGGQQQRAAIARAMVQQAKVILADEPIASLDPESARLVMDGLREMNQRDGVTVLVSVHQIDHAKRSCDRVVALRAGEVYCDCPVAELNDQRVEQLYEKKIA